MILQSISRLKENKTDINNYYKEDEIICHAQ